MKNYKRRLSDNNTESSESFTNTTKRKRVNTTSASDEVCANTSKRKRANSTSSSLEVCSNTSKRKRAHSTSSSHEVCNNTSKRKRRNTTSGEEYEAFNDICCAIGCTSTSIFIDSVVNGAVAGPLSWEEDGIDRDGPYGYNARSRTDGETIPQHCSKINLLEHKACFILVVEKRCTLSQIRQSKFYKDFPCILISGTGVPDVPTRRFLKLLSDTWRLPVFGLFDCDPSGIRIFTYYTVGTKAKAFESIHLTCPSMTWLGLCPSDLSNLEIPCRNLSEANIKDLKSLLEAKFVEQNPMLSSELKSMKKTKTKANLEALEDKFGSHWPSIFLGRMMEKHFRI